MTKKNSLKAQIELFLDRADQVASTSLVQSHELDSSITATFDVGTGLTVSSKEPNEDHLRSALLVLRQFVLESEPINIYKIYNACELNIQSDETKANLRDARKHWTASRQETWLKMEHDSKPVTPMYVADLWINGHYFHASADKEAALRRLIGDDSLFQRHVFLGYVSDLVGQVLYLRNVIKHALGEGLLVLES